MVKLKHINKANTLGTVSVGLLGVLALVMLCPLQNDGASAESVVDSSVIGVDVDAEQVMAIALTPTTSADVTPNAGGRFTSQDAAVTVATNNLTGYEIFMTTEDGTGNLKNMTVETDKVISSVSAAVTGSAMPVNQWGYNLTAGNVTSSDATTFSKVPTTNTKVGGTTELSETGNDKYTLSFGAKVNTGVPAGIYSNRVVVSTVANAIEVSNLQNLTYMQDMNNNICKNTMGTDHKAVTIGNEPTKRLIDSRDGNAYWVSKLADGNCWMTQSLAYDITGDRIESGAINPTNTDVSAVWNYSSATKPTVTETEVPGVITGGGPTTDTRSWHLGGTKKFVLATPTTGVTCNSPAAGGSTNTDGYNSVRPGQDLSQCGNLVDVTDTRVWKPTYTAVANASWGGTTVGGANGATANGNAAGSATDTVVAVKCNVMTGGKCDVSGGGEYDAHYLLGNYYQWNTATAGTGNSIVSGGTEGNITPNNAPSSICPKGWKLPKADGGDAAGKAATRFGSSYWDKYGSTTFTNLFNAYGYSFPNGSAPNIYGSNSQNSHNTATTPFYFTRAGNVALSTGSLRDVGLGGAYWSSTAATADSNAYYLNFNSADTLPSYSNARRYGFSVRCVAAQ